MEERFVAEYLRLSMEDGDVVSDNAKKKVTASFTKGT